LWQNIAAKKSSSTMKQNMKNKIRRILVPSLLIFGALGAWPASGQTYIVAESGTQLSSPVRIKPIGPEPEPKSSTLPIPPGAAVDPVVPIQPVVPHNNAPIGPEPEPPRPPSL
jgi:hypothetical protein